jgi:hypothetical protein
MNENLQIGIGATAAPMEPGVAQAKAKVTSLKATVDGMGRSFTGVANNIVGGFRHMAAGAHEGSKALKEHQEQLVGTAEKIRTTRLALMEIGEAFLAAFAIERITEFAKHMGEVAEQTYHTALTFGLTTAEVQRLKGQMAAVGQPVDTATTAMMRLDRAFAQAKRGGEQQASALRMVGISASESLTQMQLWQRTVEGFSKLESGPAKVAAAMSLFGRNIQGIGPLLNMEKAELDELDKKLERFGVVNDEAEAKGLALAEAFNTNKIAMQGLGNVLADALAPALTAIVEGVNDMVAGFIASYKAGGAARGIMEALAIVIKVAASAVIILYEGCQTLVRGLLMVGEAAGTALFYVNDLLHLDFAKAQRDWDRGMRLVGQTGLNALKSGLAGSEALEKIWGKGPPLPKLPKSGTGTTGDDPTKASKTKGPSVLERWRADLAEALADEKNFGADEAAFTLQFWRSKLSLVRAGSKAEVEIRREIARAKRAVMLEEQREELANIRAKTNLRLADAKAAASSAATELDQAKDLVDEKERLGLLNARQAIAATNALNAKIRQLEVDEANTEYEIHKAELQDELKVRGLKPDALAEINRQIEANEREHIARMKQIAAGNTPRPRRPIRARRWRASSPPPRPGSIPSSAPSPAGSSR